jgi:potassium/hydrogen antiporter
VGFELPIDSVVLTASALLVAGVLIAGTSSRFPIPASILSLGLGMVVGSDLLGWIYLDDAELVRDVAVIALVVILFEGGLTTKPGALRQGGPVGFLLSNLGVVVTAGLVALGVRALLSTDWPTALVIGAVVSSTDAAAVFDLLRKAPLPRRVAGILEVESGANDPFAILLTIGILESLNGGPSVTDWFVFGASQLLGGLVMGLAVGLTGARVMRLELRAEGFYPLMALGLAGTAYGLAAVVGGSGFLAVYVAGLVIGAQEHRHRRSIRGFHTSLASGADIALFLLLGLLVFPSRLPAVALPALAVAAVLVFVARPVAVFVCTLPFGLEWREKAVLAWGGLRGAVPIVLATFPAAYGFPQGEVIFDVVFFVVLTSVLVQGTTMVPLVRRLGMAEARPAWRSVAEVLPLTDSEFDLAEVEIPADLPIVGKPLAEAGAPDGVRVLAVVRDHRVLMPTGGFVIAADDVVVLAIDREQARSFDLAGWIQDAGSSPSTDQDGIAER